MIEIYTSHNRETAPVESKSFTTPHSVSESFTHSVNLPWLTQKTMETFYSFSKLNAVSPKTFFPFSMIRFLKRAIKIHRFQEFQSNATQSHTNAVKSGSTSYENCEKIQV